jgi:hypothetical protein
MFPRARNPRPASPSVARITSAYQTRLSPQIAAAGINASAQASPVR